jgi:hypothetical protein
MLPDGLALAQPRRAFAEGARVSVRLSLTLSGAGLRSVLGADQSEIGRIFLPGQAEGHYQQVVSVTGAVWVGEKSWPIDGCGGRDHSWGPRDWHAKRWFRWLVGSVDPGFGFMLTRAVGPHARTAGGMVWADGRRHLVDRLVVRTEHAGSYPVATTASFDAGGTAWTATGTPLGMVPLRHRRTLIDGRQEVLRIVKSPTRWVLSDGRVASGITEHHDLMVDGGPAGGPE